MSEFHRLALGFILNFRACGCLATLHAAQMTDAERLHFAHAAELLRIAQPSLCQQTKTLEDELAARLGDRTKGEVALTQPGAYFLAETELAADDSSGIKVISLWWLSYPWLWYS